MDVKCKLQPVCCVSNIEKSNQCRKKMKWGPRKRNLIRTVEVAAARVQKMHVQEGTFEYDGHRVESSWVFARRNNIHHRYWEGGVRFYSQRTQRLFRWSVVPFQGDT